jgi:hypothetical protein
MVETSPLKTLELAKGLLVLGEIQIKRERFTAARRSLDRAAEIARRLPQDVQAEITKALGRNYDDLDAAEKDKEEPGE